MANLDMSASTGYKLSTLDQQTHSYAQLRTNGYTHLQTQAKVYPYENCALPTYSPKQLVPFSLLVGQSVGALTH